jgi:hypothetical protein
MTTFYPFPIGRFSKAEWLAAYRLWLDDADAEREAASCAAITPEEAERVSISEVDLIYLSFVSEDLAARVEQFRREVTARENVPLDDRGIAEEEEAEWEELRAHLRKGLGT